MPIQYTVTCGSLRFANDFGVGATASRPLLAIETEIGIGGAGGRCALHLGDASWGDPELGAPVTVELDAGDGSHVVFTGEVDHVERRTGHAGHRHRQFIRCGDALAKLSRAEVEGAYEEVSTGFIVHDLLDQAGAADHAGTIEDGPTLPSYVVHRGPRALRHIKRIAEMIGAELGGDVDGNINLIRPQSSTLEHRLVWGEDLLALELSRVEVPVDSYTVWGEGAAGTQGPERGHWLVTDLSGVKGEAEVVAGVAGQPGSTVPGSTGARPTTVRDGAVRSVEVANDLARARANLVAVRPFVGQATALGDPTITPGSVVEIAGLPGSDGPASTLSLRARRVVHSFDMDRGLLTRVEF